MTQLHPFVNVKSLFPNIIKPTLLFSFTRHVSFCQNWLQLRHRYSLEQDDSANMKRVIFLSTISQGDIWHKTYSHIFQQFWILIFGSQSHELRQQDAHEVCNAPSFFRVNSKQIQTHFVHLQIHIPCL